MFFFRRVDFGGGRSSLSAEETEVLNNLVAAGSGSEDIELTGELLRDHELAPPLNTEGIDEKHIRVLGAKSVSFAFQVTETISSWGEDQANMVNLNIIMLNQSGARSVAMSSAAPSSSSWGERSRQQSQRSRPQQQQQQVLALASQEQR